jgi:hypothetical protein
MSPEKTPKVRNKVTLYSQKPRLPMDKDRPINKQRSCQNKTLSDSLIMFAFIDNHPSLSQNQVVHQFSEKADEAGPYWRILRQKGNIDVVTTSINLSMSRSRSSHKQSQNCDAFGVA